MNGSNYMKTSLSFYGPNGLESTHSKASEKWMGKKQSFIPFVSRKLFLERMAKYLIILLAIFMLTGCAALNSKVYVPCKKDWIAIEKANDSDANRSKSETGYSAGGNCKEQAIAYHNVVTNSNIESCVTCGILVQNSQPLKHCWNEIKCPEDGKWKLVDTSRNFNEFNDGWDVEQSPEYMPYIKFEGPVTVEDIRKEQNYFWKSDKSLSYLIENCDFQWYPIISEWRFIF